MSAPVRNPGGWQAIAGYLMLARSMANVGTEVARTLRGIGVAVRSRRGVFAAVAAAVTLFDLAAPVALLSIVRKPVDFFTFNPWLPRLPDYLISTQPLAAKVAFVSQLKIAWASAQRGEDVDWAFIIDVPTLARVAVTALLMGLFFALWSHWRRTTGAAGVVGAVASVFGLTTGPCSLAGCGAPVLPVVALAFTGASGATLSAFATISQISLAVVLALMVAAIAWFGWRAGAG